MSDDTLTQARYTISTLQRALEGASAHLRELEMEVGTLNKRVAIGDEDLENLRLDLQMERLRQTIADAAANAQAAADIANLRLLPSPLRDAVLRGPWVRSPGDVTPKR